MEERRIEGKTDGHIQGQESAKMMHKDSQDIH